MKPLSGLLPPPLSSCLVSLTRHHKWSYFHHHWMRSQNWQLQFCLSVFCFTLLSWILTSQLLKMPNHFNATVFSETSPLLLYICWIQLRFYEISVWVIAVELERTPLWTDNNSLISAVSEKLFHPWVCGAICTAPSGWGGYHPAPRRHKEGGHSGEAATAIIAARTIGMSSYISCFPLKVSACFSACELYWMWVTPFTVYVWLYFHFMWLPIPLPGLPPWSLFNPNS